MANENQKIDINIDSLSTPDESMTDQRRSSDVSNNAKLLGSKNEAEPKESRLSIASNNRPRRPSIVFGEAVTAFYDKRDSVSRRPFFETSRQFEQENVPMETDLQI